MLASVALLLLLQAYPALGHLIDIPIPFSTPCIEGPAAEPSGDEDASPVIFVMVLIVIALVLVFIGIGIALAAFAVLLFFGLVSLGIVSTSLFVGLHRKSFSKGFRVFILLATAIGGTVAGGLTLGILNFFQHWWPMTVAILLGSFSGLAAGLVVGVCTAFVVQRLTAVLQQRLRTA